MLVRVVARYAMLLDTAEQPECTAAMLNEVRQMEDRLGLTPMAMLRLRWEIEDEKAVADDKEQIMEKRAQLRAQLRIVG
jgi:hypothetical protein